MLLIKWIKRNRVSGLKKINRVLVAGGAGFIGSHLVDYLLKKEIETIVLDNLSSGSLSNLPKENDLLTIYNCDIAKDIPILDEKIDLIYHLASPACPSLFKTKPDAVLDANDIGSRKLLEIAKADNSGFIFTSSSEIYGIQENGTLIQENQIANLYSLTSRSCYVAAKRFAEELIFSYSKKYKINSRIVRLFNVYGSRMDKNESIYGRVIPNFIKAAKNDNPLTIFGDGKQFRSFCWIDDIIDALWLSAISKRFPNETMNLGKPEPISIIDLANLIIKLFDSKSKFAFSDKDIDDTLWRCPDISLAEEYLNWKPRTNLADGLKKLILNGL